MKCEKCGINPANVYIEQDINGHKQVMNLCSECASAYNMNSAINDVLQGFVNSFKAFAPDIDKNSASHKSCPRCSLTYEQFKRSGALGCPECYEVFEKELSGIFANIQPGVRHIGKIPKKFGASYLHGRELENLRKSLAEAVKNEEYEEAARLRDMIRLKEVAGDDE